MAEQSANDIFNRLEDVLAIAKQKGADFAEVALSESTGLSADVRMGEVEKVEEGKGHSMALRVFVDEKAFAMSLSMDGSRADIEKSIEDALTVARHSTANPNILPADPSLLARSFQDFDMVDKGAAPSIDDLVAQAMAVEEEGRKNSLVTNSDGASASWGRSRSFLVISNGFAGSLSRTGGGFSASFVAEKNGQMETGGYGTWAQHCEDMETPAEVGEKAAERTVAKLGAVKPATAAVPVVFHPDVSAGLMDHFIEATHGTMIMYKRSFLVDSMGQQIFPSDITITDDPLLSRGPGSRSYDTEGLATSKRNMVENGVLKHWFLDMEAARVLGLPPQGNAMGRSDMKPLAGASNLMVAPGVVTPEELMQDIKQGLFVTGVMSQGVNTLTGDYSRAANGFWIENGKIAYPVSQLAIVGNLKDMFMNVRVANDVADIDKRRSRIVVPTLRIDGMTVAGK